MFDRGNEEGDGRLDLVAVGFACSVFLVACVYCGFFSATTLPRFFSLAPHRSADPADIHIRVDTLNFLIISQ